MRLDVGDLEVTPLRIEQGRLKIFSINKENQIAATITGEALTLVIRIRNRSASLAICPTDPMYDRSFNPQFTDDTVLTVAVADCILLGKDYAATFKEYGRRYPDAGYGGAFRRWMRCGRTWLTSTRRRTGAAG